MNLVRDIKIIEAILFASGEPVLIDDLKDKIINKDKFEIYIKEIKDFYLNRGIQLIKTGNKFTFITSPEISDDLTIFKR